jgi:hypothetical protein
MKTIGHVSASSMFEIVHRGRCGIGNARERHDFRVPERLVARNGKRCTDRTMKAFVIEMTDQGVAEEFLSAADVSTARSADGLAKSKFPCAIRGGTRSEHRRR